MQAAKVGIFNSFKCSSCGQEYFTTESMAGICPTCNSSTNARKKKALQHWKKPASKPSDPDYDQVLVQQELVPVVDGLVTKLLPIIEDKVRVKISPDFIAKVIDPGCTDSKIGFFAQFKATVHELVVAMPPGMIVTVKALRHVFDIPSSNRSKCIFFSKALRRFESEGLLKQIDGTPIKFMRI